MENNTEEMVKSEQEAASETAPAAVENPAQEKNEGNLLSDIFEIVESTLIAVFVMMMVITYLLHPVNINGHSMVPTLNKYYDSDAVQDKILMAMVYTDVKYEESELPEGFVKVPGSEETYYSYKLTYCEK